ncbi:MAG: cation diffusion facilitator family transporter [Spirochaetales bacterium]|nr:cation diffusion facilitator family transporter [Spirochaetales bacterium]
MAHTHHGHHHAGDSVNSIRAAFFLNLSFTVIEIVGGFLTNSVAILSDAVHDLGDSIALALSWRFEHLARRGAGHRLTFGYRRYSVLGALISATILIAGSTYILFRAIPRILNPEPVSEGGMLAIAIVGVVVNLLAVLRLRGGSKLNQRVVFLHLIEDVLGWIAVLVASIVMMFVDVPVLDPILSIAITIFVLAKIVPNLRTTLRVFLQYAPDDIDVRQIAAQLCEVDSVAGIHDLHIWSLDGSYTVFSAHVVVDREIDWSGIEALKTRLRSEASKLGINHSTFEFELSGRVCEKCELHADTPH